MQASNKLSDTSRVLEALQAEGFTLKEAHGLVYAFWSDMSISMIHHCGHTLSLERFGSFMLRARDIENSVKRITKQLARVEMMIRVTKNKEGRMAQSLREQEQDYITRFVFLICSCEEYQQDVASTYERKVKISRQELEEYRQWLEHRTGISFALIPVTIRYPIQKVYLQKLRKKGLLPNPIVDIIKKKD